MVKSSFRLFIGTITLALTVLLSGCGQTGPLYLPKPTAKPAKSGDAKVTPAGTPAAVTPAAPADPTPGAPATPVPVTPSPVPSTLPAPQQ
ncbi:lipoprotein [Burkholderia sp. LMU1-1-1.1]